MRTIADVRGLLTDRIEKRWADSILAEVQGRTDPCWPWTVTLTSLTGQQLNEQWNDVWRWILDWSTWADANHCTIGSTNRRVGRATRSIPTRLTIPDVDTAAAATDTDWPQHLAAARQRAGSLHEQFPYTVTNTLLRNACRLTDVDFELAKTAADWFQQHDATGLTARQVPIAGLHAKWLDRNTRLVAGLSGRTNLGLVTRPSRIHFSYLDPEWLRQGHRRRDSAALDEPHQQPGYGPRMILVTENKDTALFFPEVQHGIVIEGHGKAVTRLAQIPWIRSCPKIIYWGDLDAHGLTILDLLRSTGIPAEAILMDEETLRRYAPYASPTYPDGSPLPQTPQAPTPFLSPDERRLLDKITDPTWNGPRRIEQERIPLRVAHELVMSDKYSSTTG